MKKLLFLLVATFFASCTTVNFDEYIQKDKPFYLSQNSPIDSIISQNGEIMPNTQKHKRLLKWFAENRNDWQHSPASYIGQNRIRQDSFQMLIPKPSTEVKAEGVVIQFTDKEGEPQQYSKSIVNKELNFLYE